MKELSGAIKDGRGQDLNDAFGNFEGFAVDGAKLMTVLDEQNVAVHRLVRNTGQVFGAINERRGALRELILNSKRTFEATASRDEALAETFAIFPTFLDESKATMARLEDFSRSTHPLVNDLKGPADDLGPTVRDLGDLAPDLERLFRDLGPLIRESRTGVPALERTLREAEPLTEALHTFFPELNPILSYLNFHQQTIAGFITNGGADLAADYGTGQRGQTQIGITSTAATSRPTKYGEPPPDWARGNAYLQPNSLQPRAVLGGIESFKCPTGERKYPEDALEAGSGPRRQASAVLRGAAVALRRHASSRTRAGAWRRCARRRAATPVTAGDRPRPERLKPGTIAPCRSCSAGHTGGSGSTTSSCTWSSSSSRRSSSASRRSASSRSTRTRPAPSSGRSRRSPRYAWRSAPPSCCGAAPGASGRSSTGWRATAMRSRHGAAPSRCRAS